MDLGTIPYADSLSPAQIERVKALVGQELTLEARWLEYGKVYGSGAAGRDPLQRVKEHVEERLGELRSILCGDDRLKVLASPTTDAALSLAFAVTGKLVAAQFHDIDVVQLGVLIAQCGIFAICAGKL
ncbi:MAG: hypothetical protein V5B39_19555 [Accumulibacter sp.]|jgi:hypothetical protein|uniref:hypothetical protein n=1 Tax=Accumulibacter sp. TaxID=2053492 RepID=UPI002FC386DA